MAITVANPSTTHRAGIRTANQVWCEGELVFANTGTASGTGGAATLSKQTGVITSAALTTAAAARYTLTLTNTLVKAGSVVVASVATGTNTTVGLVLETVTPAAGSVVIVVKNDHASSALNGTIKISFAVLN